MGKIKMLFTLLNMAVIAVSALLKIMQLHNQVRLTSGQPAHGQGGFVPPPPPPPYTPQAKPVFYRVTVHDTPQAHPAGIQPEHYEIPRN